MSFANLTTALLLAARVALAPCVADAQTVAGQIVETRTGATVRGLKVRLLRFRADTSDRRAVDSTRTAEEGLFQVLGNGPGVYQLEFGPSQVGISHGPIDTLSSDTTFLERRYRVQLIPADAELPTPMSNERGVSMRRESPPLVYPPSMSHLKLPGEVLAEYVVDERGRYQAGSLRVLRFTDVEFVRSLERWLPLARFDPAMLEGRAVPQRVTQEFSFKMPPERLPPE
jgi:hypothetical protein